MAAGISGRRIVSGLDIDVPAGAMIGVVGENGSGKSTLLRVLAGLDAPLAGTVTIDDTEIRKIPRRTRAHTVAWVGQEEAPSEELLVWQAVALGLIPYQHPWRGEGNEQRTAVDDALRRVGLAEYADRRCDQLSGGERRRVMLARGLVQDTGLLVVDEPANHLDIAHQHTLLRTLRDTGKTVIAAMHDLDLVRGLFDLAIILPPRAARGTTPRTGPAADVLVPHLITDAFGVDTALLTDPHTGREHLAVRRPTG
ncbi:ABC transporter ATP-binding protein [Nocardia grenadensis]